MQETKVLFSKNFYEKHLSTINNVHFTNREIDVISCLLSARGTSKIAFFLSIDPRTVETHIRNIMTKLGCNTREGIIDFIETSDKTPLLRNYYSLLRVNILFEQSLKDISKLIRDTKLHCFLMTEKEKDSLISHLRSHLTLAGITVSTSAKKKDRDYVICVLPKVITKDEVFPFLKKATHGSNKTLFLLQERKNRAGIPQMLMDLDVIDFAKEGNYYFSFFLLLKKLLPDLNFDEISAKFKDKYKVIHPHSERSYSTSNKIKSENRFVYQISRRVKLAMMLVFGVLSASLLVFYWNQENETLSFRSDLVIPTNAVRLDRPELIHQIDESLKNQGAIQTVALVGPGGAGKTTLARQYAHHQKAKIIWEINAETNETLMVSLEKLAHILAKKEADERVLRDIQETKNPKEKEDKLIQFVKGQLHAYSPWFLIYDNVEKFTDIIKYFPCDSKTWGQGKIILTTRDSNIGSNQHVNAIISIGELNLSQKLNLFTSIMTSGHQSFTKVQIEDATEFLKEIPPFPLDISIAAYYIKATNVSYDSYLKQLLQNNRDFDNVQENLLKESGDYTKTRYSIIISSLQKLLNENKEFSEMLLLISILDSQNIPRDLLAKFKDESIVDNFIYNLKKYSFVTDQSLKTSPIVNSISLHRSTQAISLVYLTKVRNLEKNKKYLDPLFNLLETYVIDVIEKENFSKLKHLVRHFEMLSTHKNLLNEAAKGVIGTTLGCMYYHLNSYEKARQNLKEGFLNIDKGKRENALRISRVLLYLGIVEREQGRPEIALNLLNQCLEIYEKFSSTIFLEKARALTYLGIIYRDLGDIDKAKSLIEKDIMIYEKFPENPIGITRPLMTLGLIYIEKGQYETGKNLIEKSLLLVKKNSDDHLGRARALTYLAEAYWQLGNYKKARELLEQSFLIYKKYVSKNHSGVGWVLATLGSIHIDIGHYEKGMKYIEQSLIIYKQHFSKDHAAVGWALVSLSNAHLHLNNYEKAKKLLERAILIFQKEYGNDNIFIFWALEKLGVIYKDLGNYKEAKRIFTKCLDAYEKYYGINHIETAQILRNFGQLYLLEDQLEFSENFLLKALKIFKLTKHPKCYLVLEDLSKLYLKKSIEAASERKESQSKIFKTQSLNYLRQALEIVKAYFPVDSSHTRRIQFQLKKIEEVKDN